MRKNSIKVLAMALSMTLGLSACTGQQPDPVPTQSTEPIALVEPIGSTVNYETVNRRNLYNATVLAATVTPSIKEYTFEKDSVFGEYKAYLGQQVKSGDVIVSANTDALDEQIKNLKKQIADMEADYLEHDKEVRESLAEPMEDCKRRKDIVETLERNKQEEYLPDGTPNPEYAKWAADYNEWTGKYRILDHLINMQLEDLNQRKALYELDHNYALSRLKSLNQQKKEAGIISDCNGEVVAIRFIESRYTYPGVRTQRSGDWVGENTAVVAVGNTEEKILQTEYIAKDKIRGVKDIYALIDGVRYEVTYQPMDTEEYTRRSAQGKVYSSFVLEGDTSNVNFGDFAVITIVTDKRENVVSVSKEALQSDGSNKYVYKMVDGQTVAVNVKTGMTDGVYTEVLSGVEEGDL